MADGNPPPATPPAAQTPPATPPATPPVEPPAEPPAVTWRDDWRDAAAQGDQSRQSVLARYQTPEAAFDALFEARNKISEGLKPQERPGSDADEATVNTYREAHGVPAEAKGYLEGLPDGLVIGEADQELVASYLDSAHASHTPPGDVHAALGWYYGVQEKLAQKSAEDDANFTQESEDALRKEWGGEYTLNVNAVKQLAQSGPTDADGNTMEEILMKARTPDGRMLGDNPDFMRWMNQIARDADPVAFVTPAGGGNLATVENRLAEIQGMMGDRNSAYWKGPQADALQKEFRDLSEAQEKLKERA